MDQPQAGAAIPAQCPMSSSFSSGTGIAQCPIARDTDAIDPRNNMPVMSQLAAPNQLRPLPVNRAMSSIPRAANASYPGMQEDTKEAPPKWEYPSPQQFYNALLRKGWNTPEEHIEAMVLIHNRLNEDAWRELLKWEIRIGGADEAVRLELAQFAGLHGHLSHKARLYQLARRFFPKHFKFTPPFDRHDWIVRRPRTNQRVRYVIDYYSSRKSPYHEPEFHLDVRPASDSLENVVVRLIVAIEDAFADMAPRVGLVRSPSGLLGHGLIRAAFLFLVVSLAYSLHKSSRGT